MAGFGFVKLGKCLVTNMRDSLCRHTPDNLVLNTKHIKFIEPRVNDSKFGAKITTVFDDVIDVPAPGVELDGEYLFGNIVHTIANAGKEGFSSLI